MPRRRLALLGALCLALAACAGPVGTIRVDPKVVHRELARSAITTGEPSWPTRNVLFERGLFDAFDERPEAALAELHRAMVAARGRPGPALRPGRAVLPARPGGQEARLLPGGRRLRLRLPLPRRSRAWPRGGSTRAFGSRRTCTTGRSPAAFASEDGSEVVPRGGTFDAALRADRGGLRSRRPARRGPRAVPVHPDRGAGGVRPGDAVSLAGPRRPARRLHPAHRRLASPGGTWWRRGSRCR